MLHSICLYVCYILPFQYILIWYNYKAGIKSYFPFEMIMNSKKQNKLQFINSCRWSQCIALFNERPGTLTQHIFYWSLPKLTRCHRDDNSVHKLVKRLVNFVKDCTCPCSLCTRTFTSGLWPFATPTFDVVSLCLEGSCRRNPKWRRRLLTTRIVSYV
jgi:hypothetical protein